MQLADLAGRGPRKLLLLLLPPPPPPPLLLCVVVVDDPPPTAEPIACKLLDADETRLGIFVDGMDDGCVCSPRTRSDPISIQILYKSLPHFVELLTTHYFQFSLFPSAGRREDSQNTRSDERGYKSVAQATDDDWEGEEMKANKTPGRKGRSGAARLWVVSPGRES